MVNRACFSAFLVLLLFSHSVPGYPLDVPKQRPIVLPEAMDSVQRVLASKPGDSFSVLKNGLTVLIRQLPQQDVVSAQVFVRAGSLYEGKYLTAGLSHYLEHVLAGGATRSFTESQAKERLQQMGGISNASTSFDHTIYYINTSAAHWRNALDLLLSYVSENILDPKEVTREKAVIQQEIKMGENNPDSELWKLFMKTAYQVSPVRHPVIGYEDVFVQQDREALLDYYSRRYQPENIIVAIAGNIQPSEVLGFIGEKTKNFTRKADEPITLPEEPPQLAPRWEERVLPIARLTKAMVGFPSVSLHDKDLYALDVLALLMGEGETSRLYRRLKDQDNQVLSVSASNWTPPYVRGQFIISLTMAPEFWPGIMKSIDEEVERFKKEPVTREELEKAKKSAIAQRIFNKETVSSQASSLASSYFDTGNPYFDDTYLEGIRRVTPEEIRDVAERFLSFDRLNVAVTQPPSTQPTIPPAEKTDKETIKSSTVDYHQLGNGLRVLLKQDSTLPMVTIKLYGLGGLLLEDPKHPGISSFTASLITAGTQKRSKLDISRAIEDAGGTIESRSDNNTYHISIKVLKDDLNLALDVLSDIVQNAQFPQDEIENKRKETLLAIQRIDENWQTEVMRLFKRSYFKDSPYRNDRVGTDESVRGFSREDILAFYHRMVNPHQSVLAVYGDLDAKTLLPDLQKRFEAWKDKAISHGALPEETHPLTASRVIEKKNEKISSALLIGTNGMGIDSADRPVLDVLDAVLSGASYPGGRLFEALRGGNEDLVYVVSAFPFYGKNAGFFGVITQTTLGNLEKVQGIILDHFRRLSEKPISAQELETAKNLLITSQQLGLESLDAQAQSASVNEVLGLGWKYDDRYGQLIGGVKAEDVQRLAKQIFSHTLIAKTIPEHPVEILTPQPPKSDVQFR